MGQYYKTIIQFEDSQTKPLITIDNYCHDCHFLNFVGLKLMEHSYLNNEWTDSIAKSIYKHKCRIAHVGDYAYEYPEYTLAYSEIVNRQALDVSDMYDEKNELIPFDYTKKYFINWNKKEYISFDEWKKKSFSAWSKEVYICPITLLTALGNGRGGGDYYEKYPNADEVGSWVWNCVSIEDEVPQDFIESKVYFTECVEQLLSKEK